MIAEENVTLTPRQHQILALAAEGFSTKQIAHRLGIRPSSVANHVCKAMRRLDATSRVHVVAIAIRQGLLCGSR